jgi:hypothetical protein
VDSPLSEVPGLIVGLIDRKLWPATTVEATAITFDVDTVRAIAPAEREICLHPPPFLVLDGCADEWFDQFRHWDELDYEGALILGDFGIGSDNPIVLDAADPHPVKALSFTTTTNPDHGRLPWPDGAPFRVEGHWIVLAPTLEQFVVKLGLLPA